MAGHRHVLHAIARRGPLSWCKDIEGGPRLLAHDHPRSLELPHGAQLRPGAFVVVELRVGVPRLVGHHQLRTEAIQGEGAVVDRGAQDTRPVLPRCAVARTKGNQLPS